MRLVSVMVAMSACLGPSVARAQTARVVDVEGTQLQALVAGHGAPTVVFEAGLGDSLKSWDRVWPSIAEFTSVVAYSRRGYAGTPLRDPPSAQRAVQELRALLMKLGVAPPYVLVGHSYGGLLVRLFSSMYPSDVAGLVIVDGSHEQQKQRWLVSDSQFVRRFEPEWDKIVRTGPATEAAELREFIKIQASGAVDGLRPLRDMPLAVLTSVQLDSAFGVTPHARQVWRAMHAEWFQSSSNAMHIVTARSGHYIQDQEPLLVINAIRFVVDHVRTAPK